MSKRFYMRSSVIIMAALLSACGSGDLAEDLTPVPTLRPGQTPTLVAALAGQGAATESAIEVGTEANAETGTEAAAAGGAGAVAAGEELFASTCSGCHGDAKGAGPARVGMGERAAVQVEGLSAEEYLHQSIVDPSAHVVEDFPDIMPKDYGEQFDDEQINNLVAYLLTQ